MAPADPDPAATEPTNDGPIEGATAHREGAYEERYGGLCAGAEAATTTGGEAGLGFRLSTAGEGNLRLRVDVLGGGMRSFAAISSAVGSLACGSILDVVPHVSNPIAGR